MTSRTLPPKLALALREWKNLRRVFAFTDFRSAEFRLPAGIIAADKATTIKAFLATLKTHGDAPMFCLTRSRMFCIALLPGFKSLAEMRSFLPCGVESS